MDNKKIEKIVELKKRYLEKPDNNTLLEFACAFRDAGLKKKAIDYFLEYLDAVDEPELKKEDVEKFFDGAFKKYAEDIKQFFAEGKSTTKEDEFDGESLLEMANLLYDIGSQDEAKQNYLRAFDAFIEERNLEQSQKTLNILKNNYKGDKEIQHLTISLSPEVDKEKLTYFVKALDEEDEIDKSGELYYVSGMLFRDNGLMDDAVEQLEKGLSIDSSFRVRSAIALIKLYEDIRDTIKIKETVERALNFPITDNEKLPLYYKMANMSEKRGELETAKEYYRIVYNINPEYLDVKEKMGMKKAEEAIEEVISEEVEEEPMATVIESISQKERIEFL